MVKSECKIYFDHFLSVFSLILFRGFVLFITPLLGESICNAALGLDLRGKQHVCFFFG